MSESQNNTPGKEQTIIADWNEVLRQEITTISAGRAEWQDNSPPEQKTFGLAFSGGGIRSATFNLGVLQSLAQAKLLKRIDYLSTVSGGGYIGSWFSALLHRKAITEEVSIATALTHLEVELSPNQQATPTDSKLPNGISALKWLRRYSAFLTPRYGLFGLDTLAALAGLFRNLLLNQAILICLLMSVLLVPYILLHMGQNTDFDSIPKFWLVSIPSFFIFLSILDIRRGLTTKGEGYWDFELPGFAIKKAFIGSSLAAFVFYLNQHFSSDHSPLAVTTLPIAGTIIYLLAFIPVKCKDRRMFWWAIPTSFALGVMFLGYSALLQHVPPCFVGVFSLVLGPAILIQLLCMAAILHTGLAKRGLNEINREWLARAGGQVLALEMAWVALTSLAIISPALIIYLEGWVAYGGAAWALGSLATFWTAYSDKSGGKSSNKNLERALSIAPYLVMLGLLILLSFGLHKGLLAVTTTLEGNTTASTPVDFGQNSSSTAQRVEFIISIADNKLERIEASPPKGKPTLHEALEQTLHEDAHIGGTVPFITLIVLALIGCLLAWRVDINLFSMHQFYRNRLARAYLGASNSKRKPNAFTDFDDEDDLPFSALSSQRPVHLINSTLNLTDVTDKELQWQERRGAAFMFSPHYCGYNLSGKPEDGKYTLTNEYMKDPVLTPNGVMLGTAVAVAGAAASPNMGFISSPPLAFLMTFFNVRLGRWCPNTAQKNVHSLSPRMGLKYLLKELTGATNEESKYLNLTDGGHFENLGVYELVRRKCKVILASDAGADSMEKFCFDDLGNAIQKCRVDFGVNIEMFGMNKLTPRNAGSRVAWGRITYPGQDEPGVLIYIRPLLRGNEPLDVYHYAATHESFPHESTADQWFEESQFESYRELGLITTNEMLRELNLTNIDASRDCNAFIDEVAEHANKIMRAIEQNKS